MKVYILPLFFLCIAIFTQAQPGSKVIEEIEQHYENGNYEACLKLIPALEELSRNQRDTALANGYFYIADAYSQSGNLAKAVTWFERENNLRTALGQAGTEDYSASLYNLADIYLQIGAYEKAGATANKLIQNDRKIYKPDSDEFVSSVLSVAEIYIRLDKFNEAEKLLQGTIRQQPKNSMNRSRLLNKLGDLYTITSRFSKADKTLEDALAIVENIDGEGSDDYINTVINLGILYTEQGKYPEAEEAFDYVLSKIEEGHPSYPDIANNQALVYHSLGQLDRAENFFNKIKSIDSLSVGDTHPDFAITLSNLALVYSDKKEFKQAEKLLLRALDIQKKNGDAKTVSYARKLNNLARVYRMAGQPEKAIQLHEQALALFKKLLGENTTEYATTSFNLGMAYWKSGKGSTGIKYLKKSAAIRATRLGKKHPQYAESLQKIGEYQWEQKQFKEARQTFREVFESYYAQIEGSFPVLTEEEKSKFYFTNIKPSFEKFNAFALSALSADAAVLGDVYNHHINTKGAIMYASEKVREAIQSSKDTVLIRNFELWQSQKEQIARFFSQSQSAEKIDSLQELANALEKDLARRSSVFSNEFIRKRSDWSQIEKVLNANEAAVEVIRFTDYSPVNGGTATDEIIYAFLVITKNAKTPHIILMKDGKNLENKFLSFYRNNIRFMMEDNRSFGNYLEPLIEYLKKNGVSKFYFSPDGVYNQISINTILNPPTNKFLLDEFDIRIVTNTSELLSPPTSESQNHSTLLIGYPKFNLHVETSETPATTRQLTRGSINRGLRGGLLRYMRGDEGIAVLPGTEREIREIARITDNAEVFIEAQASEELIKQILSPNVVHIATHGYFLEDQQTEIANDESLNYVPNPLLRSGIILAGAENFLNTGIPVSAGGDDGILTAYEAMNLKLDETDLVVLSACETGLGVVKNGEGVYGLRRAFRIAGAKRLVMSLWSVDDEATQELMSTFYAERKTTSDDHTAFRQAQRKLMERYNHPFYWGAFVIVGL